MQKVLRVAMIGSREQEKDYQYNDTISLCSELAYESASKGVVMTSGLCSLGMDAIAQRAYASAFIDGKCSLDQFEVYVSSQKLIDKSTLPLKDQSIIVNPSLIKERDEILRTILAPSHYTNCSPYALSQHGRNICQILGDTLDNPVDAVLTWTPSGRLVGGTKTALLLAQKNKIPIFNLGSNPILVKKAYLNFLLKHNGI